MSYCDDCLHKEVCGLEGNYDEALKFCDDKLIDHTQGIKDAIAEIERKTNSGQWSEATVYGMQKAVAIIRKHTKVGDAE